MDNIKNSIANILMIDDCEAEALIARNTLKLDRVYLNLESVHKGENVVPHLLKKYGEKNLPDLILLDINMPDLDGKDVLTIIKTTDILKNIPVVIYSGSEAQPDIDECENLGAVHYMKKTINFEKVKESIEKISHLNFVEDNGGYYLTSSVRV